MIQGLDLQTEIDGKATRMNPMNLIATGLIFLVPLLGPCYGYSLDGQVALPKKHEIQGAIRLSITSQGQKYLNQNMKQILRNSGVNFSEGYFNEMEILSDTQYSPEELEKRFGESGKVIKQVRKTLTEWLVGFTLKDHRPVFQLGSSEYAAEINRMSLLADQNLMSQLGHKDGAVLVIELEVKKIVGHLDFLKVWDLNNPQLGRVGVKDLTITIAGQQTPLFMRLPFYVSLNQNDEIRFEILSVEHNLNIMPVEVKYQSLIVPQLMVELNGYKYPLNTQQLNKTIYEQMPNLISKSREAITEFARKDLPKKLNELAEKHLKGQIEEIQQITPPGREKDDGRGDFLWGLRLKNIFLNNDLVIGFNAYIEDTSSQQEIPLAASGGSRGPPQLSGEKLPHDLVMSLDRAVINRILDLSYRRGYFEKISSPDGSTMALRAPPIIDYMPTPKGESVNSLEAFLKIKVMVEVEPGNIALKDKIVLGFDIMAKLAQAQDKNGMEILLSGIDLSSVSMDPKYVGLVGKFVPFSKIMSGIKEELAKQTVGWKTNPSPLTGKLDLPPPLLGQRLDLQKVSLDPNGHLLMYLSFPTSSGTNRENN